MDKMEETTKTRVNRIFLTKSGYVWIVWEVYEMPEMFEDPDFYKFKEFVPASDGTTLFPRISMHLTKDKAMVHIGFMSDFFDDTTVILHDLTGK